MFSPFSLLSSLLLVFINSPTLRLKHTVTVTVAVTVTVTATARLCQAVTVGP